MMRITVFLLCFIFFTGASNGNAVAPEMRVLFICNSLTYWNDLPAIVQAMAKAGKQTKLKVEAVAFPDHSLEVPGKEGSYLAALVFYKIIFSQPSTGLPSKLKLSSASLSQIEIEKSRAKILQQAAELSAGNADGTSAPLCLHVS